MTATIQNTRTAPNDHLALSLTGSGRKKYLRPDPALGVTYSRFSTALQNDVSIERQEEACVAYAAANGITVVDKFADRARSGGSLVGRVDLERMVNAAKAGKFGILLVENVDRLARDLGILSTCFKALENVGVSIHQPGRGKLTLTDIAFQGLMGDEGRRMMSERSQYARNVMAREGRSPTGEFFGYARVPGRPGELVIDEAQAAIVRRIFRMRLDGVTVRQMCNTLVLEGVSLPRSGGITSAGLRQILRNERFTGLCIYGRHHTHKDRETGRRTITERPRSEWIVSPTPHLRIVDADIWDAVQAMRKHRTLKARARSAKSYMFTGLVKCRACGGIMTSQAITSGTMAYGCKSHNEDDTCSNERTVNARDLERLVLGLLAERLGAPAFAEAFVDAYNEEGNRAERAHAETRAELERKVARLTRKIDASFDDAVTDGFSNATRSRMRAAMERDLTETELALAALPRRAGIARIDLGGLATLSGALRDLIDSAPYRPVDVAGLRVVKRIRDLVERIVVTSTGYRCSDVEVHLRVNRLCDPPDLPTGDLGAMTLKGSIARPDPSYRLTERASINAARHARGEFDLSEEDWGAVDALITVDVFLPRRPGPVVRRAAVETLVFLAMTGAPQVGLPKSIGRYSHLSALVRDLRASGTWDRIAKSLAERHPDRFADLPARPFLRDNARGKELMRRRAAEYGAKKPFA